MATAAAARVTVSREDVTPKRAAWSREARALATAAAARVTVSHENVAPKHAAWSREVRERCGGQLKYPIVWTKDELSRTASKKLPNCIYVRGEKEGDIVRFMEMKILKDFLPSELFEGIVRGAVLVDFDARTNPTGSVRNHGTKFRVRKLEFSSLYDDARGI